jgi:hypothetical protein
VLTSSGTGTLQVNTNRPLRYGDGDELVGASVDADVSLADEPSDLDTDGAVRGPQDDTRHAPTTTATIREPVDRLVPERDIVSPVSGKKLTRR